MKSGLDRVSENPKLLSGLGRIGLITHQAVTSTNYQPAVEVVHDAIARLGEKSTKIAAIFGPQHGYGQTEQDNMFETPDAHITLPNGAEVPLFSLYSKSREPSPDQMALVDTLLVDMPDIGCRVYTYIQTLANCMDVAAKLNKRIVVLDRPNPIGMIHRDPNTKRWRHVEGNTLDMRYASFVGCCPVPLRHGLSIGEFGLYYKRWAKKEIDYRVIEVEGLRRNVSLSELAALPWTLPSPNMPNWEASYLFPGFVVLEATNISEGRGSTLPFLLAGAPWQNSTATRAFLEKYYPQNAVSIRPHDFRPTFNKHAGKICKGLAFHITNPENLLPFELGTWYLFHTLASCREQFQWKEPGYEYNFQDPPYLLVLGHNNWAKAFDAALKQGITPESEELMQHTLQWAATDAQRFGDEVQDLFIYR
jgi:uncharacterized protein YbbC (DUF1343 family)